MKFMEKNITIELQIIYLEMTVRDIEKFVLISKFK